MADLREIHQRIQEREALIKRYPKLPEEIAADIQSVSADLLQPTNSQKQDVKALNALLELKEHQRRALQVLAQANLGLTPEEPKKPRASRKHASTERKPRTKVDTLDVEGFSKRHSIIVGELKQSGRSDFYLDDLVPYADKPNFNHEDPTQINKAKNAMKSSANEYGVKIPRGGKGLSLDKSIQVLAALEQHAKKKRHGPKGFSVIPEPPKR